MDTSGSFTVIQLKRPVQQQRVCCLCGHEFMSATFDGGALASQKPSVRGAICSEDMALFKDYLKSAGRQVNNERPLRPWLDPSIMYLRVTQEPILQIYRHAHMAKTQDEILPSAQTGLIQPPDYFSLPVPPNVPDWRWELYFDTLIRFKSLDKYMVWRGALNWTVQHMAIFEKALILGILEADHPLWQQGMRAMLARPMDRSLHQWVEDQIPTNRLNIARFDCVDGLTVISDISTEEAARRIYIYSQACSPNHRPQSLLADDFQRNLGAFAPHIPMLPLLDP